MDRPSFGTPTTDYNIAYRISLEACRSVLSYQPGGWSIDKEILKPDYKHPMEKTRKHEYTGLSPFLPIMVIFSLLVGLWQLSRGGSAAVGGVVFLLMGIFFLCIVIVVWSKS